MACFLVPTAEAIVTTVAAKKSKANEAEKTEKTTGTPFYKKLSWLNYMLWGGSAVLAVEHVWHGEIVPHFPFLTAAADPVSRAQMLREMATTGVAMALLVTLVWLCMVAVSNAAWYKRLPKISARGSALALIVLGVALMFAVDIVFQHVILGAA